MVYKYYSHFKFVLLNLFGLISSAQSIVLAFMVGSLTDIATRKSSQSIPRFLVITISAFLVTFFAQLIFNYLKTDAIKTTNTRLRSKIFRGMLNTSTTENSNSLSFLTNDFKLLETNRFEAEISILIDFYTLVLALSYAIYLNWILTLVVLIGAFLPMIASNFFQKPIQQASEKWSEANSQYVNQSKNFLAGTDTFRLYGCQDQAVKRNADSMTRLENALQKMNRLNLDASSYVNLVVYVGGFMLPFLIGVLMVLKGATTIGTLFAEIQLANTFISPIMSILDQRNKLATTKKIVTKVNDYVALADQKESQKSGDFQELAVKDLKLRRQNQVLAKGIDFELKTGERLAIIGSSGSGKSTLLQFLLTGEFGEASEIQLNEKAVQAGSFKQIFASASQKPTIFAADLWFNLTLGVDISRKEVEEICSQLDLEDLVKSKGFDYSLGDNADQLSGGQLARIELARAILARRAVLLLDEINASLDHLTDQDIHRYLFNSNHTFVEVIHHYDQQTLQNFDRVLDLNRFQV